MKFLDSNILIYAADRSAQSEADAESHRDQETLQFEVIRLVASCDGRGKRM